MRLEIVTAPADYPVSLAEVKQQARIDTSSEDELVGAYLAAAVEEVQSRLGQFLLEHTVYAYPGSRRYYGYATSCYMDSTHGGYVRGTDNSVSWSDALDVFPRGPLQSVSAVEYIAPGESSYTAISADNYSAITSEKPGRLFFANSFSQPSLSLDHANPIRITAKIGYGQTPDSVPVSYRNAIRMLAAYYYAYREGTKAFPEFVEAFLRARSSAKL